MLARLVYPLCLLVGALLAVVAGVLHPDLAGDGAAQLTTIAQCAGWHAIHWTFLFGFPLALTGLVGFARMHAATPGENAVREAHEPSKGQREAEQECPVDGEIGRA